MSAISVEGVSKRYRKGVTGYRTLREDLYTLTGRLLDFGAEKKRDADSQHMWALRDVSFEVKPGERVGIIGRNGSGKTTLLRLLAGVTRPTQGTITVRGRMGVLIEIMAGFHPELTGRENIYLNGAIMGMSRREIAAKFDEIVAFSELEDWIDTPIKRYSSGMHVRLGFAVAAHLDPDILLVDEVLAVGDAAFQKKCLGKMETAAGEGRTVLFVSHNMDSVKRLCQRSILLDQGRIAADSNTEESVKAYLGWNRGSAGARIWDGLDSSPGNENTRLSAVRVVDSGGMVSSQVDIQKPCQLEMEFTVLASGCRLYLYFLLHDQDGNLVFTTVNNHEPGRAGTSYKLGRHCSRCTIPGNLLAGGTYAVTVAASLNMSEFQFWEDSALRFDVVDTGGVRGFYQGSWKGVVRPMLEWRTEEIAGT